MHMNSIQTHICLVITDIGKERTQNMAIKLRLTVTGTDKMLYPHLYVECLL